MTDNTEHHDENKNHERELCTPFCSCAGCISPVFYQEKQDPEVVATDFYIQHTHILSQHFSSYKAHDIWQPPRV